MPQHHYTRATAMLQALCAEQARPIAAQLGVAAQDAPAFAGAVGEAATALIVEPLAFTYRQSPETYKK